MTEHPTPSPTPYERAKASHEKQLQEANAAYRRGEGDIYKLLHAGQWANYELSQHKPDKPKPHENTQEGGE